MPGGWIELRTNGSMGSAKVSNPRSLCFRRGASTCTHSIVLPCRSFECFRWLVRSLCILFAVWVGCWFAHLVILLIGPSLRLAVEAELTSSLNTTWLTANAKDELGRGVDSVEWMGDEDGSSVNEESQSTNQVQ